jgi:hypothetical protein
VKAAAAVLAVPLALRVGMWVGALSSHTVLAVVPALLTVVVLPPLCVVGAERWRVHRLELGGPRLGAAVGVALGVQVLMLVGAVAAGASARRLGDAALLTLVEAAVLPPVVTWAARRSVASVPSAQGRPTP